MKLTEFNSENTKVVKSGLPRITLGKAGMISINKFAAEKIGFNGKAQIKFFQDQDDATCWYVELVSEKGFHVRLANGTSKSYIFNNATLVRKIIDSTGTPYFLLAGQPTEIKNRKLFGLLAQSKN